MRSTVDGCRSFAPMNCSPELWIESSKPPIWSIRLWYRRFAASPVCFRDLVLAWNSFLADAVVATAIAAIGGQCRKMRCLSRLVLRLVESLTLLTRTLIPCGKYSYLLAACAL